jgi:hypothetical protein
LSLARGSGVNAALRPWFTAPRPPR